MGERSPHVQWHPEYERRFLSQPDGDYELGESYLTISLGEPYEGYCYKLVAA